MSASAVCTADFSTVVVEAPSDAITSRFNAVLDFILSFVGPQGGGIDVDTVVSFGLSHVGIVMWGPIFLVFLILAALPLCCARCCCTTRCCAPKPEYIVPGYPAKHCDGYGIATLVWFVFWAVLAILVIYLPFAFGAFGSAINEWSCVVVETADTASGLIADYQVSVAVIFDIVIDALATIVTLALNLISDVSADTISINDTITDLSDSINEGCANITTSIEYERLVNATGFEYSCSNLDVASQAAAQIDTIIDALSQASTQITSLQVSVVAQINDVESSVADIFTEIEQTIDTFLADLFNQTLLQNSPPIPIILPEGGTMTYVEVTETATSNFPSIGALMIVFSALGLFFWLIGVLLVGCIKCKAKSGSRLERSDEVKSGCCGRCLSKFGCVCGYWGAFLLCFFAIVFLAVTPVFLDVVAVYHAAPYNLDSALDAMVQAQILAPDNVSVYENAVDECFFGNGQASVILSSFGFDISTILGSFDLSSLDIDQYANVTSEVESAQAAVDSARTDLENFKFTSQDLAYADDAADNCCNYGDLFALFTDDCSNPGSTCNTCDSLSDCNPSGCTPPSNGSPSAQCNELARDARVIMLSQNTLVDNQLPKVDSISDTLDDLAAVDTSALQAAIDSAAVDVPADIQTEVDSLSCSEVALIYFGVYDLLLAPMANTFASIALVITLIIFCAILLVFISIPVDVRLGNDGVDLNNVQQSVIRSVESSEVAIEMAGVDNQKTDELPVAEPVGYEQSYDQPYAGGGAYSPQKTDEYGTPQGEKYE